MCDMDHEVETAAGRIASKDRLYFSHGIFSLLLPSFHIRLTGQEMHEGME